MNEHELECELGSMIMQMSININVHNLRVSMHACDHELASMYTNVRVYKSVTL